LHPRKHLGPPTSLEDEQFRDPKIVAPLQAYFEPTPIRNTNSDHNGASILLFKTLLEITKRGIKFNQLILHYK
jgi:hypothetical protein